MTADPFALGMSRLTQGIDLRREDGALALEGFGAAEASGRWSLGPQASLSLALPAPGAGAQSGAVLRLGFVLRSFVHDDVLPAQRVLVSADGIAAAEWVFEDNLFQTRVIELERAALGDGRRVRIGFTLPDCARPSALGINSDGRALGIMLRHVDIEDPEGPGTPGWVLRHTGRRVGGEASKCFDRRLREGFWQRFIGGPSVLDIGFRGHTEGVVPIVESAIGVDIDYPGYDGRTLPFPDGSQDAVFSSHCLEHIADHLNALRDWMRVTRVGGHVITAVPHAHLYERKRRPPSRWNADHKRFYTPAALLAEFEAALPPNSYRVRLLEENDEFYRYELGLDQHPMGCYEVVLVIQKIEPPAWGLVE